MGCIAPQTSHLALQGQGSFGQVRQSVCSPLDVTAARLAMQGPRCLWALLGTHGGLGSRSLPTLQAASAKGSWGCRGSCCPLHPPSRGMEIGGGGGRQSWGFYPEAAELGRSGGLSPHDTSCRRPLQYQQPQDALDQQLSSQSHHFPAPWAEQGRAALPWSHSTVPWPHRQCLQLQGASGTGAPSPLAPSLCQQPSRSS